MKRLMYVVLCVCALLLGGCATSPQEQIRNDYSFGHQSFGTDSARISMLLPFEIAQVEGKPWMRVAGTPAAVQNVAFRGLGKDVSILVSGSIPQPDNPFLPLPALADNAIVKLKQDVNNRNVQATAESVTIASLPAQKITATYDTGPYHIGLVQYLFVQRGVLWNIVYLYPLHQPEAEAMIAYIAGKIQIQN